MSDGNADGRARRPHDGARIEWAVGGAVVLGTSIGTAVPIAAGPAATTVPR